MSKEIYLIRHGKSSWHHAGEIADVNRPLAVRGVNDAKRMSGRLAVKKVKFDRIYASHGNRALHTAVIFTQGLGQDPSRIYIRSDLYLPLKATILELINECDDRDETIAIFTHDPGITDFAFSTKARLQHVATAGIVHYKLNTESWREATMNNLKFQSYDFPKNPKNILTY